MLIGENRIETFPFQHVSEPDDDSHYNEDLYTIYSSLNRPDPQQDAKRAIERMSKCYRPNITPGFDVKHFKLIRSLGQGMNGSVRAWQRRGMPCGEPLFSRLGFSSTI